MSGLNAPANNPGDTLILVDADDRDIGFASKEQCHRGAGTLHRAFSVFVFNHQGQLLLQQRSLQKPLWPGYWSNSCCSHPRRGERTEPAARRRVREELNLSCEPQFLYKFEYHAQFGDVGAEHELCSVFAAVADGAVRANENEISAWRWVTPQELTREIEASPDRFTPWLKLEWRCISDQYLQQIQKHLATESSP